MSASLKIVDFLKLSFLFSILFFWVLKYNYQICLTLGCWKVQATEKDLSLEISQVV